MSSQQEGFLLGAYIEKQTQTITDNDKPSIRLEKIIKVNSAIPCPKTCYFYDGLGNVDKDKLKSFLGLQALKIVGWYKYKSSTSYSLTLREKIIHKRLADFFSVVPELFCYSLITVNNTNISTYTYKQTFIRYHDPIFQQIPMHIVNLNDSDHTYKSPQATSDTFNNLITSAKIDPQRNQGSQVISKIQAAVQARIHNIIEELSDKETQLFNLENEIRLLKQGKSRNNQSEKEAIAESSQSNNCDDDLIKFSPSPSVESSPETTRKSPRGRARLQQKDSNRNTISPNTETQRVTRSKTKPPMSYSQVAQGAKN